MIDDTEARGLAIDRYRNDARFHAMAQHVAAMVLARCPEREDYDRRHIHDAVIETAAVLMETWIQTNFELKALREERDKFRDMAFKNLSLSPLPVFIDKPGHD